MNPADQKAFEEIFGQDALKAVAKKASDAAGRRVEGWARTKGSALPDMRKGKKPRGSGYDAVPMDPRDGGATRGRETLEPNQPLAAQPKARDRYREPVVEPVAKRKVRTKSGKPQNYQVALTAEEHAARAAKLEADNAAIEAARADAAAAAAPVLRLPDMDRTPPAKLRDVDGEVRRYAWQTTCRQRPKSVPPQVEEQDLDEADPERDWDTSPRDAYAATADHLYDCDELDDRPQWEIDHADAIAEEAARVAALALEERDRREAARLRQEMELLTWIDWVESDRSYRYYPYRGATFSGGLAAPAVVEVARAPHLERAVRMRGILRGTPMHPTGSHLRQMCRSMRAHSPAQQRATCRPLWDRPDPDQEGRPVPPLQELHEEEPGRTATTEGGRPPQTTKGRPTMTDATRLEEIRRAAGAVSVLAERCQDDIIVSVRLPDGRVLAPTTAVQDMQRFLEAKEQLRALLDT